MPEEPALILGREGHPSPRGYFRNPSSTCSSRLESDDLPRYRMIEEPGPGSRPSPATKIEDRSACVSSHRGVAPPRRLPLYSMGRKPVWDGPPVFTCGCARPWVPPVPRSLEGELRDLSLADAALVAGQDGRVDRRGAGCQLGLGQRFAPDGISPVDVGDPLHHAPSLPRNLAEIWPATAWRRPVRPKQTDLPSGAPGRGGGPEAVSRINPPRPPESLWVRHHRCPSRGPGGKRPAGQNASAQVEGGEGQDKDRRWY